MRVPGTLSVLNMYAPDAPDTLLVHKIRVLGVGGILEPSPHPLEVWEPLGDVQIMV